MEFADLEALIAVSEAGSVAGAADRAGLARSGLVRAIERLEAEVGGPLVVTEPAGTRMTRIGQGLVADARPLLRARDRWRGRLSESSEA